MQGTSRLLHQLPYFLPPILVGESLAFLRVTSKSSMIGTTSPVYGVVQWATKRNEFVNSKEGALISLPVSGKMNVSCSYIYQAKHKAMRHKLSRRKRVDGVKLFVLHCEFVNYALSFISIKHHHLLEWRHVVVPFVIISLHKSISVFAPPEMGVEAYFAFAFRAASGIQAR